MPAAETAPVITGREDVTDEVRATAAEHYERRTRELSAQGVDETVAIESAAGESILHARRLVQDAARRTAVHALITAYDGNTYQLLRDLADHLGASVAYVNRATVEAHLQRRLSELEWAAANEQFTAMDFDDHAGDHGAFRTDWIEDVLATAGVPGRGYDLCGEIREQVTRS
jgi:hypothetical protein